MDFFGIGFPELLLILFIALMVFGPGKLPEIAKTMGQAVRTLKMTTTELTRRMNEELEQETKGIKADVKEISDEISGELKDISNGIQKDLNPAPDGQSGLAKGIKQESADSSNVEKNQIEM
ncbi:MAG: twin-arginine translocase TatA/TatE family subunit [Dehalococcoidia bacterium]